MKSLKAGGSLVTCGATSGPEASFDIRFLFARQLSFLGSYMGTMGDLHQVLKQVFNGRLKPVIDTTFPLKDAAAAHQHLENKEQFGKVVLVV
jgi:NADPH:quinone reductase-like Zn-dependent oxidoreductase